MNTVWVLGANGLLGSAVLARAQALGLVATALIRPTSSASAAGKPAFSATATSPAVQLVDLSKPPSAAWLSQQSMPEVAFFCAAITGFGRVQAEPELAHQVNIEALAAWAIALRQCGVFCVFPSSSAVFSAAQRAPDEVTIAQPCTPYGQQKHEGEQFFSHAAVVRLTKVLSAQREPVSQWLVAARRQRDLVAADSLFISPVSLAAAVDALLDVARHRATGVWHLSGESVLSYRQVAQALARSMSSTSRVRGETMTSNSTLANCHLAMEASSRVLGWRPQSLTSVIEDLLAECGETVDA